MLPGWDSLARVSSISYLLQWAAQVLVALTLIVGVVSIAYARRRDTLQEREATHQTEILRAETAAQAERARADAERRVTAAQADADRKVAALTVDLERKAAKARAETTAAIERESQARSLSERASEAHRQNLAGGSKNVQSELIWKDEHVVGNNVTVRLQSLSAEAVPGTVTASGTSGTTAGAGDSKPEKKERP